MKKQLFRLAIALTVCLLFLSCTKPKEDEPGKISVTSTPSGAAIWLDHKNTGFITPHLLTEVEPGSHLLRLTCPNHFPLETKVETQNEQTKNIVVAMTSCPNYRITYNISHTDTLWETGLDGISPVIRCIDYYDNYSVPISWSPNGSFLLYPSQGHNRLIKQDGSLEAELPAAPFDQAMCYNWSNSSTILAYSIYYEGIYGYNIAAHSLGPILYSGQGVYSHNPSFSPDDSRIAYTLHTYGTIAQVRLMNQDGSGNRSVSTEFTTSSPDCGIWLWWISDNQIIFMLDKIYLVNINSNPDSLSSPTAVFDQPDSNYCCLQLSPDRAYYILAKWYGHDGIYFNYYAIYLGRTGNWTPTPLISGLTHLQGLTWSPNNDGLVFCNDDGLYWLTLDGNSYRVIDLENNPRNTVGSFSIRANSP